MLEKLYLKMASPSNWISTLQDYALSIYAAINQAKKIPKEY